MLTIGDLARTSGVAPSAVRFYDKQGLVASVRTAGNQRRFHQAEACVIRIIRVAQRVGLTVAEIRELMASLPADRAAIAVDDFLRLRKELEAEAQRRISALSGVLDDLESERKLCEVPAR